MQLILITLLTLLYSTQALMSQQLASLAALQRAPAPAWQADADAHRSRRPCYAPSPESLQAKADILRRERETLGALQRVEFTDARVRAIAELTWDIQRLESGRDLA